MSETVNCPKCGGETWDQKGGKYWGDGKFKSGKPKPRWECKDKECAKSGGVKWEPKGSEAKAANGAQAQRGNGGIPAGAGSASVRPPRPLVPLYEDCFSAAKGIVQKQLGAKATTADVVAATATLFIQATKNQSPLFAAPAPAAVADDFEEWPGALDEQPDPLPF